MAKTLLLGGPGTGKTHTLLQRVEHCLQSGIQPHEIAMVTFTKAAANEAKERAAKRFNLGFKELPHFRTVHSLCFAGTSSRRGEMLKREHHDELSALTGEHFPQRGLNLEEGFPDDVTGEHLLHLEQLSRVQQVSLEDIWRDHADDVDWFRLKRFCDAYARFKRDNAVIDFTDLLERYASSGVPVQVKVAIVDEAQDLTLLQWRAVERAFNNVDELIVGGDDDQSIHEWAGAAVDHFLRLPYRQEHLAYSHRLPRDVLSVGNTIAARMQRRFPKPLTTDKVGGGVFRINSSDQLPLGQGEWLVLARTRHQVLALGAELEQRGVLYSTRGAVSVEPLHARAIAAYEKLRAGAAVGYDEAVLLPGALGRALHVPYAPEVTAAEMGLRCEQIWHDALLGIPLSRREYYLACRRQGEKLLQPPRIRLETIHGSKGLEAPNVALFTDITERIERGMERWPDAEHRVFYVGATRARENLYIVEPQTDRGYQI